MYLTVLTNLPDQASAQAIASLLVEKRLAACVNIMPPVVSTYRWQGKVETVNVLESRRYLGFDTPSNSASLTSALVGDGDWSVAMQPGSRLSRRFASRTTS